MTWRSVPAARRQAPSQSAFRASGESATRTYDREMPARLDILTAAQRRAVTHEADPPTPLLVLGGPGTGKTRVLTERFAWLADQGIQPDELLFVTASDAAAGALRRQVE